MKYNLEKTDLPAKRAAKQEERIAKKFGGVRVSGSGSGRWKGDVDTRDFKIEAKYTDKHKFPLSDALISKIKSEAFSEGKSWAVNLKLPDNDVYIISEDSFQEYLKLKQEAINGIS